MGRVIGFDSGAVAVAEAGNTTVLDVVLGGGIESLHFEVNNSGAKALDAFTLQIKAHPQGAYEAYEADWSEDSVASDRMPHVGAVLKTLGATTKAQAIIRVVGAFAIRFIASGDAGATTVVVKGVGVGI